MYKVNLSGKRAIVSGASRGIGKHIAEALFAAGAAVIITGRERETIEESAAEVGEGCTPMVCDLRRLDDITGFANEVIATHGPPDILVNNAGVMVFGAVTDTSLAQWNSVIETNLTGAFLLTKAFLPAMMEREEGDIFFVNSMSGKRGDPGASAYAASKFGLQGFAQALLYEVRSHNIRVMTLNPSSVNTGPDVGPTHGHGLALHAADIAATVVHLCALPRRTLVRDLELWATNP